MKTNLDNFTEELSKAMDLSKAAVPTKVYAKWRQWLKGLKSPRVQHQDVKQVVANKAEDLMHFQALKKNQVMTSVYEGGVMKMDFGGTVPEPVRKAALRWARKKGLKVVEASLAKSADAPATYVLGLTDDIVPYGRCLKRFTRSF